MRCSSGAIFDVVVDLRRDSPTYLRWESFTLTGDEQTSVYIPAGCAHGFQALTEPADISYRIDRPHNPAEDLTIAYDDPSLGIRWPLPVTIMSARDRAAPGIAGWRTRSGERGARDAGNGPIRPGLDSDDLGLTAAQRR